VIFAYNLVADRLTPYSSYATVQAYIVGIAPEMAGNAVEVTVIDNQMVDGGDLLFRINPSTR
jgi:multidrug resistance efflux pump